MNAVSVSLYTNMLAPHTTEWVERLATMPGVSAVHLFCDAPTSPARLKLGWPALLEAANVSVRVSPTDEQVVDHVRSSPSDMIHIFMDLRHLKCVSAARAECLRLGRRFGILHEPREREGLKGWLRFAQSWLTEAEQRRHADFVLAIGAHGPDWFRRTGYKDDRIFPFAYFVNPQDSSGQTVVPPSVNGRPLRVGYVGRLEESKGIGDLLAAMPLVKSDITLEIAGVGGQEDACMRFAEADPRVRFLGVLPWSKVQAHMAGLDLVVQPSRTTDDGWGVVISEALMSGAAALASDVVGASMCLADSWRGGVVPVRDPQALAAAIDRIARECGRVPADRARRAEWARARLSAEAGASYALRIFDHVYGNAPRPPSFID